MEEIRMVGFIIMIFANMHLLIWVAHIKLILLDQWTVGFPRHRWRLRYCSITISMMSISQYCNIDSIAIPLSRENYEIILLQQNCVTWSCNLNYFSLHQKITSRGSLELSWNHNPDHCDRFSCSASSSMNIVNSEIWACLWQSMFIFWSQLFDL